MSDDQRVSPSGVVRACDPCRSRKIRCDRKFPCSNCQLAGAQCSAAQRAPRPKQARVLISSQYENKIDHIESQLQRLIESVEKLGSSAASPPKATQHTPSGEPYRDSGAYNRHTETEVQAGDEQVMEGQSSLSAHSSSAMNFLRKVASTNNSAGQNSEIGGLLDTLRHIVESYHDQRASSKPLFPLAQEYPIRCANMPPLDKMVFVLQNAKDGNQPSISVFEMLLASHSLSDLCLKVYFSQTYSDAEFIIVNTAFYALIYEVVLVQKNPELSQDTLDEYKKYYSMCQMNIETALAGLPLCLKASHDLTLALFFGAAYAVDILKPTLSWNLLGVASQHARTLGFHTRSVGTKDSSNSLNYKGLLFWAIYMLERFLCLRLGRTSSFQDNDVTLPPPKASSPSESAMDYFGNTVLLASLAGRIYEQLYCAGALSLPADTRQARVAKLSQEMNDLIDASHAIRDSWMRNAVDVNDRNTAIHTSMSGDVQRFSMLTLIHRAIPHNNLQTTISDECIATARDALEKHSAMIHDLDLKDSILLTSYITWSILFVPFVPFIALFCHVIETGDVEDLTRMQTFVTSLESACPGSRAIANHHHLFHVFHSVSFRYTQLRDASTPSHEECMRLRTEMDTQLHALGLQVQAASMPSPNMNMSGFSETHATETWPGTGAGGLDGTGHSTASGVDSWEEQSLQLGNWFSFSQNMMQLLDGNEWPL